MNVDKELLEIKMKTNEQKLLFLWGKLDININP